MLAAINLDRKKVYISISLISVHLIEGQQMKKLKDIYLISKHIEIINPKILVLLGSTAMNALIGNEAVISKMRGKMD